MRVYWTPLVLVMFACSAAPENESSAGQPKVAETAHDDSPETAATDRLAKMTDEIVYASEHPIEYQDKLRRCYTPRLGEVIRRTFDEPEKYEYDPTTTLTSELDGEGFNTIVNFHHHKDVDGALLDIPETREASIRPDTCHLDGIRKLQRPS